MKAFDQIQKYYAIVGILPSDESILTFNNRIRLGFLLFGFTLGCQSFVLLGANGFMEYLEGFSALFTTMILFVCFAANVFQQALLFKCIHDMERLMVTSKIGFHLLIESPQFHFKKKTRLFQDAKIRNQEDSSRESIDRWSRQAISFLQWWQK